jgi:hypothetical protein
MAKRVQKEQAKVEAQIDELVSQIEQGDEKEYIENVTLKQQTLSSDQIFDGASIPLTETLIKQIKIAVESRIEATADDTKDRIARINENYRLHEDEIGAASDGTSMSKTFFPEIYNSVEDWVDDLYKIFEQLPDKFSVSDIGDDLESFIPQKMGVKEKDDMRHPMRFLRSMLKILMPEAEEQDMYYFQKKEAIKQIMVKSLKDGGFRDRLEKFFRMGVISGEFCLKDKYSCSNNFEIVSEDGRYELKKDATYQFTPIDTRTLIFPKRNRRWVMEKISTTFSTILGMCVDQNNKPIDNPPYDIKMLEKVAKHIKEKGTKDLKKLEPDSSVSGGEEASDVIERLWDIDGEITVIECHHIPLLLDAEGGKRPYFALIHAFDLSDEDSDSCEIIPIGCRLTPYTVGVPYLCEQFIDKDGDMAGVGLPQKLKPLQTLMNDMTNHAIDIANLALWGIMIIDPDCFKDTINLKRLVPRQVLKLKDMKGRSVDQVLQWVRPETTSLQMLSALMPSIEKQLKRTSRKGPGGEPIASGVSATEAQSVIAELQKSVNTVAMRLNNMFLAMMYRMYIYNVTNKTDKFKVKMSSYRIKKEKDQFGFADYDRVDKLIELDKEEIIINGLQFSLEGIDAVEKKAVQNQQRMQAFKLLVDTGALRNPDGTPHMMTDDSGAQVQISEYKAYSELLDSMDFSDIIERVKSTQPQMGQSPEGSTTNAGDVPPLTAGVTPANVAAQSQVTGGVNV